MIELHVDEARTRRADHLRGGRVEAVRLELVVLPVDEVVAVRRNAQHVLPDELVLGDERPLAGRRVYAIEIRGGTPVVGDVAARVRADSPASVLADLHVA